MRGEKQSAIWRSRPLMGSPPRARGKDLHIDLHIDLHRITPACAGKSAGILQSKDGSRDHPRVRGEKALPRRR